VHTWLGTTATTSPSAGESPSTAGRRHHQRDIVHRAGPQLHLLGVVEHVDPRTQLGERPGAGETGAWGGPAAALPGREPGVGQASGCLRKSSGFIGGCVRRSARRVAVAGEGEYPGHLQTGPLGRPGNAGGSRWPHSATAQPAVDLHHDPHPAGQRRQAPGCRGRIGTNGNRNPVGQAPPPS